MKQRLALLLSGLALAALSFTEPPGSLKGRWQKRVPDGTLLSVLFRSDSTFEGFSNGKSFLSGKYYVRRDTFAFANGGCGLSYYGTYKLTFSTQDSVQFAVIQDTCGWRRRGSNGLTMGRVRAK